MPASGGTLYLVATPIGNLGDLSPRAAEVLGRVALVAAEDTRRTGRLLQHIGLRKPLISCFEHNERDRVAPLLAELLAGRDVALVSDAGTPLVSDPGYPIVRAVVEAGLRVEALPGPCAALLALQLSGLPTDTFTFVGFPPKKGGKRTSFLRRALLAPGTVVAYVAARDVEGLLDELAGLSPQPVDVAVARELTKVHEEVLRGTAEALADKLRERAREGGVWKGETTLVWARRPGPAPAPDDESLGRLIDEALAGGETRREVLARLRSETGLPRARLYDLMERRKAGK